MPEEQTDVISPSERKEDAVKHLKRILSVLLVVCMMLSLTACMGFRFGSKSSRGSDDNANFQRPEQNRWKIGTADDDTDSDDVETPEQLSMEDIQKMNGDTLVIDLYNNDGYLSSLIGKFYNKKVENMEDAVLSVRGIAGLLGLSKGCEFFCTYVCKDLQDYTYYKFQQRYGGYTLQYATMTIVVDPDGYTAGITSSFVPNVGVAEPEEGITAQEAENIVREKFERYQLTYYTDKTIRLAATINDNVYNCWVVFTNNPDSETNGVDMPYLEHYVTLDGTYALLVPSSSFIEDNSEITDNSAYFEGLQTEYETYELTLGTGDKRTVTVPISYNPKTGLYYLVDPERKIAAGSYPDMAFHYTINLTSASSKDGFSENNLFTYDSVIKVWDFYASHGLKSVDGFGTPVFVALGYCDSSGNDIDNACYFGINRGWACVAFSEANRWGNCLDMVGHEFTHGVTRESMRGMIYSNETGSINESYSDIMGNIIEMTTESTNDRNWQICEMTGQAIRDMSNPNRFRQPQFVGDAYYVTTVENPDFEYNDYGGVHVNNSLVGHIAYLLDEAGMSLEQQYAVWFKSIELLTPLSDYEDLHGILLFSLKINGLLQEYGPALNQAFADAGLNENWDKSYQYTSKTGCGRLTVPCDQETAAAKCKINFFDPKTYQYCGTVYPDSTDLVFTTLLPAGTYIIQLVIEMDGERKYINYYQNSWTSSDSLGTITIKDGEANETMRAAEAKQNKGRGKKK